MANMEKRWFFRFEHAGDNYQTYCLSSIIKLSIDNAHKTCRDCGASNDAIITVIFVKSFVREENNES